MIAPTLHAKMAAPALTVKMILDVSADQVSVVNFAKKKTTSVPKALAKTEENAKMVFLTIMNASVRITSLAETVN